MENSQLGSGCIINGKVKNSLISRGVKIQDDALIEESLVLPTLKLKVALKLNLPSLIKEWLSKIMSKLLVVQKNQ